MPKNNLWVLTEERPKNSVVQTILEEYCRENNAMLSIQSALHIKPIVVDNKFSFDYAVENVSITDIDSITIKMVDGNSSFVDYLLVRQVNAPANGSLKNVIMAFEETKTGDDGSRNTAIYQRASKFVYIDHYCPSAKKYMLYNEEMTPDAQRTPTATNIFGTSMLLTLGVRFIGKTMLPVFRPFSSVDEMLKIKSQMRLPNHTNTPILINKISDNEITISGKLDKKGYEKTISHDPNIGGISCMGYTLRKLGWTGRITLIRHNIEQSYINRTGGKNKCLYLFARTGITMQGLALPQNVAMPELYWKYSNVSEKIASILLHLTAQYSGIHGIYENHAGCERGYYKRSNDSLFALPKKNRQGTNLLIPDLVLLDHTNEQIFLVEGKRLEKLSEGLSDIQGYDSIEYEYIKVDYPKFTISRWLTLFGGSPAALPHAKVLLSVGTDGSIALADNAPQSITLAFRRLGFRV